ncbi:MAG: copper resistance protein NlpE N-terminal domain-containing protein [Gemmatimonadaceae bacterium]|nr:copper resistance protein NlpE N-terminal domain-containing protein [Gemmatimonadaceae bacterium]MCW5826267.1 copper resistance protein NlpE N-terminal domain-containing protein [Gemmatimonadaceae bacterium]
MGRWSLLPFALAALAACGSKAESAELPGERVRNLEAGDSLPRLERPAGFAGTLPCADCPGIETWLQLNPDGSYRLRERWLDRSAAARLRVGRWTISRDSIPQVALLGSDSTPRRFAMTGALTLRELAQDGSAIESQLPLDLARVSLPADWNASLQMRGEFRYFADAATIVACDGGMQYPVAGDSAFIRLQRAYVQENLGTLSAILVDASGRLEVRPGMEEGTRAETFVVDSFRVVDRKAPCNATTVHALLAIGDWQLGALDGVALGDVPREQQPTLRFVLSESTMFGNAGCNRFTGRAVLRGAALMPAAPAVTKRACADEATTRRELRYTEVLGAGGWFRLDGAELVLSRGGTEVARFWRR